MLVFHFTGLARYLPWRHCSNLSTNLGLSLSYSPCSSQNPSSLSRSPLLLTRGSRMAFSLCFLCSLEGFSLLMLETIASNFDLMIFHFIMTHKALLVFGAYLHQTLPNPPTSQKSFWSQEHVSSCLDAVPPTKSCIYSAFFQQMPISI